MGSRVNVVNNQLYCQRNKIRGRFNKPGTWNVEGSGRFRKVPEKFGKNIVGIETYFNGGKREMSNRKWNRELTAIFQRKQETASSLSHDQHCKHFQSIDWQIVTTKTLKNIFDPKKYFECLSISIGELEPIFIYQYLFFKYNWKFFNNFFPTHNLSSRVVWLKGNRSKKVSKNITLLKKEAKCWMTFWPFASLFW